MERKKEQRFLMKDKQKESSKSREFPNKIWERRRSEKI